MHEQLEKFYEYLDAWNRLDAFRLNWWLRYPLWLPFGFFLEMRNLNAKGKLTKEYGEYLETLENKSAL